MCIRDSLGGVDGSEIITSVAAALIRTCDPSIDYSEAYELGCSLLETQDAKKINGITYQAYGTGDDLVDYVIFMSIVL